MPRIEPIGTGFLNDISSKAKNVALLFKNTDALENAS
jgi:hypothetical protein